MIKVLYREDVWKNNIPKELRIVVKLELESNENGFGRYYDRSVNGYIVIIEPTDDTADMSEIGFHALSGGLNTFHFEVAWERATPNGRALIGLAIMNNDFALTIIVPDEKWVNPVLKRNLIENLTT
ncbi:MAG: hypothetical protein HQL69_15495 [Magnetococcales bacterium]|nr:hypothetical protein [Magnetococcales bacterium]